MTPPPPARRPVTPPGDQDMPRAVWPGGDPSEGGPSPASGPGGATSERGRAAAPGVGPPTAAGHPAVETQVIIQARLGSTRLPGKVLLPLRGRPVLAHVCTRAAAAARVDRVVVATTDRPEDDAIVDWCQAAGVAWVRGAAADVLARYLAAVARWPCTVVVRVTADCPAVDPGQIDAVVACLMDGGFDYASNVHPPTLPVGFDVEALPVTVLERLAGEACLASHREHVTLFIRENPDRFRIGNVRFGRDRSAGRFVLDHPQDYEFFTRLYALLPEDRPLISVYELLALADAHPELTALTAGLDRAEGARRSAAREGRVLRLG